MVRLRTLELRRRTSTPARVATRGLSWDGTRVLGAAAATVASAFFPSTLPSILHGVALQVFSYLVVVVRDIGVLAIVGSLVLQALTSPRTLNRDETQARREL